MKQYATCWSVLYKNFRDIDPAISGSRDAYPSGRVFAFQNILAVRWGIHPFLDRETRNVSESLAHEKVFTNSFPASQTCALGSYIYCIAVSIPVVEEASRAICAE